MGKGRYFGSVAAAGVLVVAAAWWSGCGKSNDQGISFRAVGFFADPEGTVGDAGRCASLEEPFLPADADNDGQRDGGFLQLQNNLVQGLQVERVDITYRISGGSLALPTDSFPVSRRLGPSSGQEPNNPPTGTTQILLVSPQVMELLRNSPNQLPPTPFTLIVNARAVGISDAGDTFETNRVAYTVLLGDDENGCAIPTPVPTAVPQPTATVEEPEEG